MSMQVTCPGCQKKLAVKQELLGKKIKCAECQTVLALAAPKTPSAAASLVSSPKPTPQRKSVASPSGSFLVACPCGSKLRIPSSARGKQVRCSTCKNLLKIPAAKTAPAPTARPASAVTTPQGLGAGQPPATPGDGLPAFDQAGFDSAAPFPAPASPKPADDGFGTPAAGGDFSWDSLPSTGDVTPIVSSLPATQPASARTGARADDAALAAAGAFRPSLEEKMGGVVAATNQAGGRSWGEYFGNRIHLAIVGMMLAGPFIAFSGWQTTQKLAALEKEGVTVPGVILSGDEYRGRRSRSYSFEVAYATQEGDPRVNQFSVDSSFFHAHISGDSIGNDRVDVTYRPDDPDQAILVGGSTDSSAGMYIGLVMTVLGICGFCFTIFVSDIDF